MTTRSALTMEQALRRAAVRATQAPSVRNIQPWRFFVGRRSIEIQSEPVPGMAGFDPSGRQSVISCGCALFNARVSLAADRWPVRIDRCPDPHRPELLARLMIADPPVTDRPERVPDLGYLDAVVETRRSSRRPFDAGAVAEPVVAELATAAAREGGRLLAVTGAEDRAAFQDLSVVEAPCVVLLCTAAEGLAAWLWAGEALEHLLLLATRLGYAARPLTELLEPEGVRARLARRLTPGLHPQALILVGHAPETAATRRRRLVDVLVTRP